MNGTPPPEREKIKDMWQRAYSQQEIADTIGQSQPKIASFTTKVSENYYGKTNDFPPDFDPPLYNVWKVQT